MASPLDRLLTAAGARVDLVPRQRVEELHGAHLDLLGAIEARARAEGARDAANALYEALGQERERVAQEGARGVLHSRHTTGAGVERPVRDVERALFALGLGGLVQRGAYPPYMPAELDVRSNRDEAVADMTGSARHFIAAARPRP
jgi:hypothetical protein